MINDETIRRGIEFGRTVTELRQQAGVSIEELADRLGCRCTTLAHVEAHGADPTVEGYLQVMYALDPDGPNPLALDDETDAWGIW